MTQIMIALRPLSSIRLTDGERRYHAQVEEAQRLAQDCRRARRKGLADMWDGVALDLTGHIYHVIAQRGEAIYAGRGHGV